MSKRLNVALTDKDLTELGELIQYTLAKISLIVERHEEVMNTRDINIWRSMLDELLILYISGLSKTHIEILQNTMDKLFGGNKGSGII